MNRAYIGFGALGRQLENLLDQVLGVAGDVCYFDDIAFAAGLKNSYPFKNYTDEKFNPFDFFVGIGYKHPRIRQEILETLIQAGRRVPSFVHPTSFVNPLANIGRGSILYPCCNIDQGVDIGQGTFLNNSVVVSHDSQVGDYTFLAPGVIVSGNARIGKRCFIGTGTVIANGIEIGDDVVIGIGTAVTRNIPSGSSVIGNPMRVLSNKIELQ